MSDLRIADEAEFDLDEIWAYIAKDSISAADRLIGLLTRKFSLLAGTPLMGRRRDDLQAGMRSFVVKRYIIYYRPIKDGVEVLRVLHSARDVERLFET